MATLESHNQALAEKSQEFLNPENLHSSVEIVGYAMDYILDEGDKFSEQDTLSILRALNILRGQLQSIYLLQMSIQVDKFSQSRNSGKPDNVSQV
ncbi:MAG: hypothetical protein II837_07795 [Treponema sp.]|nr:hypothetical protein [Treponema sp.]